MLSTDTCKQKSGVFLNLSQSTCASQETQTPFSSAAGKCTLKRGWSQFFSSVTHSCAQFLEDSTEFRPVGRLLQTLTENRQIWAAHVELLQRSPAPPKGFNQWAKIWGQDRPWFGQWKLAKAKWKCRKSTKDVNACERQICHRCMSRLITEQNFRYQASEKDFQELQTSRSYSP